MDTTGPLSGYAILFRTHVWDKYVERQYQRLCAVVGDGDVFVLLDETNGPVPVPHDNVISHTTECILALQLSKVGSGNLLWFNGDYPLYYFYTKFPKYRTYVVTEYDVAIHRNMDDVVAQVENEGLDFVGQDKGEVIAEWPFTDTCLDVYLQAQILPRLICISIYSNRAVGHLFKRRLEMSRKHAAGEIKRWPYCEGYIATELALAGMKLAELSHFGRTDRYAWKPAILEAELPQLADQAFAHPVLDAKRYVPHTMRDMWPPEAFFDPRNGVARRLRRAPIWVYGPPMVRALLRRAGAPLRSLLSARH